MEASPVHLHIIFDNWFTLYQIRWRPCTFDPIIKLASSQKNKKTIMKLDVSQYDKMNN